MARVKRAVNSRKNHKKVLKLAKGYYGGKSRLFKTANETVIRALRNAYVGRRLKKRDFRRLWIARINAASRMNGLSYSKFMNGMKLAGIDMNRKMLSEIAINDPKAFADLVEVAMKFGIIHKAGAWFSFVDLETGEVVSDEEGNVLKFQGQANLTEFIRNDAVMLEELREQVNSRLK